MLMLKRMKRQKLKENLKEMEMLKMKEMPTMVMKPRKTTNKPTRSKLKTKKMIQVSSKTLRPTATSQPTKMRKTVPMKSLLKTTRSRISSPTKLQMLAQPKPLQAKASKKI